jgi:hypothetical protein
MAESMDGGASSYVDDFQARIHAIGQNMCTLLWMELNRSNGTLVQVWKARSVSQNYHYYCLVE